MTNTECNDKASTTSILPHAIQQSFNAALLTHPIPTDDCELLWKMWQNLENSDKTKRILEKCPAKKKKYQKLTHEFLRLYERAKTIEEDKKKKTGYAIQRPFYSFRTSTQLCMAIYWRLKYGRTLPFCYAERKYHISKIRGDE